MADRDDDRSTLYGRMGRYGRVGTAIGGAAVRFAGSRYLGWEIDRVAILRDVEDSAFFQSIRGGLVTGIYNNPDLWPVFGYEGESASKGGYLKRGFDDIDWL